MWAILIFFIINNIISANSQAVDDDLENSTNGDMEFNMGLLEVENKTIECLTNKNATIPHWNCNYYYRCDNGISALLKCKSGHLFDSYRLVCLPEGEAMCRDVHTLIAEEKTNKTDFCQHQADGLYPDYSQNCLQYLRCQSGNTVLKASCPENQVFSFYQQRCVKQDMALCVKPSCSPSDNQFFWLPATICRSYYYCKNNTPIFFNCPPGKEFSLDTKDCVTGGECFEPICAGKIDGNHSDTTQKCQRYLQCKSGLLEGVTSCPDGQLHNGHTCISASLVQCQMPETTAVSVETIQDDCRGSSDGWHVIPATNCRRFQVCQDGKALARFICPTGTIFNGQNCAPQSTTSCQDICTGKPNGYQPDKTEGCRKYHYCKDGKITERHSCPDGSIFSGIMCLPIPLVTCDEDPTASSNLCLGLRDGFHGNYLQGCNQYFYCSGFNLVFKSVCPKNKIWRFNQCVPPKDNHCLVSEQSKDCSSLPTGLYQDKQSWCKKYFYCHKGNKTLLNCPKGEVFDGDSCRDEKQYICPSLEPNTCFGKADGYRVDTQSGCKAYYFCSNNYKITYVCPNNQIFNGTMCVDTIEFKCPYEINVCNNQRNGYYSDFQRMCKKYFYCHDGYKLNTLDCGKHKIFDGYRCIFTMNPQELCKTTQTNFN